MAIVVGNATALAYPGADTVLAGVVLLLFSPPAGVPDAPSSAWPRGSGSLGFDAISPF
jgi:hypothetical protein